MQRPVLNGGMWAATHLAARRVVRRRGPSALVALSVAATIAVLGALFGVAAQAADAAIHQALLQLPPGERAVVIERFTDAAVRQDEADQRARALLGRIGDVTEPVVVATWFPPEKGPNLVLALDDVDHWVSLVDGRLPAPCTGGQRCEAVAVNQPFHIGSQPPTTVSVVGDIELDVVGTVELSDAFPLELPGTAGEPLVVNGAGLANAAGTADYPRTSFWIAQLDPDRFHAWAMADVEARLGEMQREMALTDAAMTLETPGRAFGQVADQAAVANGRIVFVGSLVVAVLFAFAFFAAAIDRDDLRAEYRRLVAAGARRRHLVTLIATEALLPSLAGAILGWVLAIAAVMALARVQGGASLDLLFGSLLTPDATMAMAAAALVLTIAVAIGLHPAAGRFLGGRTIGLMALPVVAVLVWDRIVGGSIAAGDLASGAAGPGTVLLPGLLGLAVILASLAVLPPLFRRLAGRSRRLPLALRLAVLSIARDPLRPAATLTLLGFSFGSALFGLSYGATLRQGATDAAAFTTGMDIRVAQPGFQSDFVRRVIDPVRSGALGPGLAITPIVSLPGQTATSTDVDLIGIDAAAIPRLRGWRPDFSDRTAEQLRDAIVQPGDWRLPGHTIPLGARSIAITMTANLGPDARTVGIVVRAIVDTADGGFRTVNLGNLKDGRRTYQGPLFTPAQQDAEPADQPVDWRVVAIVASLPDLENGFGPDVTLTATLNLEGLPELADPAQAIHVELASDRNAQVIRGPVRTDGLILPAIVAPTLLEQRDSAGQLSIALPNGLLLHLRPVASARLFPTATDPLRVPVVVDAAPLLQEMNAFDPGVGVPTEALISTPDDAATAAAVAALGKDPFPKLLVASRPALEAAAANDPFAVGMAATLLVGAVAGLVLALAGMLLAALAELRDERGELADLEEQGLPPAALRRLTTLRSVLVLVLALFAGTILGLGLAWFTASTVSVGLDQQPPMPPLVLVVPWLPVAGLAAGLAAAVAGGTLVLGLRRFGERRLLREAEA